MDQQNFKHVDYNWDDSKAPADPVERLVYRSNCLGADQRITNTGGGNTSSKISRDRPADRRDRWTCCGSRAAAATCARASARTSSPFTWPGSKTSRTFTIVTTMTVGRKTAAEDEMVAPLPAGHVQPQPAGQQHRHAAARLHSRRSTSTTCTPTRSSPSLRARIRKSSSRRFGAARSATSAGSGRGLTWASRWRRRRKRTRSSRAC